MKRILFIFLSLCLLTLPAPVQAVGVRLPKKITAPKVLKRAGSKVRPARLKKLSFHEARKNLRLLNQRVERTFNEALLLQEKLDYPAMMQGPALRAKRLSLLSAKRMYPDKPFLQHPLLGARLAESYFLAKNNRLFMNHLREMGNFWPAFQEALPRFYEEARTFKQPEKNLPQWAAEQVSAEIKDLFIGEVHDYQEITQFVRGMLSFLREQNPDREIFLFTEFLEQGDHTFIPRPPRDHYDLVWEKAEDLHIPVVGLEVFNTSLSGPVKMVEADGSMTLAFSGVTFEGMRMRNDHWWKLLQRYRQKHPDALFVIYTGSGHSFYNYPFSLAKRTPKKSTLMIELNVQDGEITNNLESINPALSFPQTVLKWSSPDLIELSGFDISIKLPENPQYMRKRLF